MLHITVPPRELYDATNNRFMYSKEYSLALEHSLVSISKWESRWCKPFLYTNEKTDEEILDYIKCMTLTQNVPPEVYLYLTEDNIAEIKAYIDAPMTATTFTKNPNEKPNREIITSEIIYYWMSVFNLPPEYQKWHIKRLMTLIQVCSIKHQPPGKRRSSQATANHYATLNAARKKKLKSRR